MNSCCLSMWPQTDLFQTLSPQPGSCFWPFDFSLTLVAWPCYLSLTCLCHLHLTLVAWPCHLNLTCFLIITSTQLLLPGCVIPPRLLLSDPVAAVWLVASLWPPKLTVVAWSEPDSCCLTMSSQPGLLPGCVLPAWLFAWTCHPKLTCCLAVSSQLDFCCMAVSPQHDTSCLSVSYQPDCCYLTIHSNLTCCLAVSPQHDTCCLSVSYQPNCCCLTMSFQPDLLPGCVIPTWLLLPGRVIPTWLLLPSHLNLTLFAWLYRSNMTCCLVVSSYPGCCCLIRSSQPHTCCLAMSFQPYSCCLAVMPTSLLMLDHVIPNVICCLIRSSQHTTCFLAMSSNPTLVGWLCHPNLILVA